MSPKQCYFVSLHSHIATSQAHVDTVRDNGSWSSNLVRHRWREPTQTNWLTGKWCCPWRQAHRPTRWSCDTSTQQTSCTTVVDLETRVSVSRFVFQSSSTDQLSSTANNNQWRMWQFSQSKACSASAGVLQNQYWFPLLKKTVKSIICCKTNICSSVLSQCNHTLAVILLLKLKSSSNCMAFEEIAHKYRIKIAVWS